MPICAVFVWMTLPETRLFKYIDCLQRHFATMCSCVVILLTCIICHTSCEHPVIGISNFCIMNFLLHK